jgi:hypothetical protein
MSVATMRLLRDSMVVVSVLLLEKRQVVNLSKLLLNF